MSLGRVLQAIVDDVQDVFQRQGCRHDVLQNGTIMVSFRCLATRSYSLLALDSPQCPREPPNHGGVGGATGGIRRWAMRDWIEVTVDVTRIPACGWVAASRLQACRRNVEVDLVQAGAARQCIKAESLPAADRSAGHRSGRSAHRASAVRRHARARWRRSTSRYSGSAGPCAAGPSRRAHNCQPSVP